MIIVENPERKVGSLHFNSWLHNVVYFIMLQAKKNEVDFCVPQMLSIQESKIPGAGQGVFARLPLTHNTRLGPYDGDEVETQAEAFVSGYSWAVSTV